MLENLSHTERQDRAITAPEFDALGRAPFVSSLVKALVHTDYDTSTGEVSSRRATGFVVGLTGEWGLGKSSVLNLLEHELKQMKHVTVATLNPWLFKGRDEVVEAYFNALREALGYSSGERTRQLLGQLARYKASIEFVGATTVGVIDALAGAGTATTIWNKWLLKLVRFFNKPKELSANQERKNLEAKLAEADIAVVILIDELDRVEDEEVRVVAQLVKAVGDIKGISYLVAYDPSRVAQALGKGGTPEEKQKTGESYLEKIIQFAIPLRPLFIDDARDLLLHAMRNNGVTMPAETQPYQAETLNQLLRVIRTPREIKRLIGAFALLEEIVRGEICPFDVLAYSWLVTKAPSLRGLIADNVGQLVNDPSTEEMLAARQRQRQRQLDVGTDRESNLIDILGDSALNHLGILQLLFTRFNAEHQRSVEFFDGHRLGKRRNLIRLLYLGNPPGQFPRTDIEALWALTDLGELEAKLSHLKKTDQLRPLLDRVGDFSASFPESSDGIFWIALGRVLVREHDWIWGEEVERNLVDDACAILWRVARDGSEGPKRLRHIVHVLIEGGDLLIVPWLLRKHLFVHGLTNHNNRGDRDYIFEKDETIALRDKELPRYHDAVADGTALKKLPDTEMIFCLVNSNYWDSKLKEDFTSQMDSMEAIVSFAALIMPPGILCEKSTLDIMLETDTVLKKANALLRDRGMPESEWLAAAVRRLRAVLAGRDVHSADGLRDDFDQEE
ncbi:KAP family NTPase [Pseudomonas syringae pv. syringae]|uniref:KAP family NTPase n=1 Tax=Pseudomonas syringae TaxID=317 RepID=UPI001659786F|nr:KAP family NTPase [Pseudomonas syringae]MBC9745062.1 KAP family NTPase [Pseudomonas syringae pv. syringae]MBC9749370.1 KAP family NTPase [Pseudomonas syringae pv. syringae]MCK9724264.1 KAP family NTPase [Pseudomonas syringae pv. syringae]